MAIIEENYVSFLEHPEKLLSNLHHLYLSNMFVDLCLVCHGNEVYAHKAVIAAASPFFREKITEFGEYPARINLEPNLSGMNINVEDIKLLIEFIYKGKVQVPGSRLTLFLDIGSIFQITGLYNEHAIYENAPVTYIPQNVNNYYSSQLSLPHLGVGEFQDFYEDSAPHNELAPDDNSVLFSSILSPEKLSDNSIKSDKKTISAPVTSASFSDFCPISTSLQTCNLFNDKGPPMIIEDSNPKVPCDMRLCNNENSIEDVQNLTYIGETSFPLDFSGSNVQLQSERGKYIFEDRDIMSSTSVHSDPDVLFSSLTVQHNSYLSPGSLDPSIGHNNSFPDISFNSCKISSMTSLPERQMRLKVKDSIGGVSLQDTSQGEKDLKDPPEASQETTNEISELQSTEVEADTEPPLEETIDLLEDEEEIHICPQCLKCFSSFEALNNHLYEDHKIGTMYKCLLCSYESLNENSLVEHGKDHLDASEHQCCICGKKFKTKVTLKNHLSYHAVDKWFKCTVCPAQYSQKNNLLKHLASEHHLDPDGTPIRKQLSCSLCSYVTWAPHKLKNHESRTHSKDKPFKCSQCPYSASEKTSLVKHFRTHTQERPYMCDSCGLSFVTISSLKRHARSHAKEKPFECKECGQKYADSKRLRDHYLKHKSIKPFKCGICEYSCRRKDNLQSHIRRNHGINKIDEIVINGIEEKATSN